MTSAHDAERLAFLERFGVAGVRHNSREMLLPHLVGTRDLLREWGARPALCDAGLFHSVYGTEYFPVETLSTDKREDVRAVIGAEAEAVVWLWCFAKRHSLPADGAPTMRRLDDDAHIALQPGQHADLVNLWIADTLEQLPRVPEREILTARALAETYARFALPAAQAALEHTLSTP